MLNIKARSLLVQRLMPRICCFFFSKVDQKSKSQGQNVGTKRKVLSQEIQTCNMKAPSLLVKKIYQRLSFFFRKKVGQKSRSRGQNFGYGEKGLVTRNTHVQYVKAVSPLVQRLKPRLSLLWTDRRTDRVIPIYPKLRLRREGV